MRFGVGLLQACFEGEVDAWGGYEGTAEFGVAENLIYDWMHHVGWFGLISKERERERGYGGEGNG